ncbi:MAG: hypothetical protein FWG64_04860 [Firmicutes bacterium]|nr:hypothetical protein [Bacillota bacterium]
MDDYKLKQIAELLVGLKHYEWRKIVHSVEQLYNEKANRLVLADSQKIIDRVTLNL